jgi:hypothetical protein
MTRGPKGEKRPRDTNQLAELMVDILTGDVEDREPTAEERGVDPAAAMARSLQTIHRRERGRPKW